MAEINVDFLPEGKGRLTEDLHFDTPIKGHWAPVPEAGGSGFLEVNGQLTLYAGFTWDYGSCAIDTPAMIIASAAHDAFCLMTDAGILPWSVRAQSDKYFRDLLKENGVGFIRRWYCWAGVRGYSKFVAYWKAGKDD